MFSQSADQSAPDQSPAPVGMRELPPQPAKPVMPAYTITPSLPSDDEAGPGPDDSVVAKDDHLEGTFTSRGTVRVLGSVKGRIEAVRVRIEDGAQVDADVIVDEAIIAGEFTGNLTCRVRLEARASGRISGHVETHKLMLHEGASVEGEMHMLTDSASDASETIRGTAPVRGEDQASRAKSEPMAPAPRADITKAATPTPTSSTAPTPSAPSVASTATAKAVVAQLAARPDASVSLAPSTPTVRVTPRATSSVGAGGTMSNGNGNGNGASSGF